MANFLTRAEIDLILEGVTSKDLFASLPAGQTEVNGGEVAGKVFEHSAQRQNYGADALERVHLSDGVYLAGRLGELFSDSPKDEPTVPSLLSPDSGDSAPI